MWQEYCSLLSLQELLSLYQVDRLQVDEILDDDNRIRKVKARGLLYPEFLDDFLESIEK